MHYVVTCAAHGPIELVALVREQDLPEGSRPKQTNLLRTVTRVREGLRPTEPKDLNFELAENFIPEDFNVKDVHVDDYRHLVFYTSDQMKVLSSCTTWYLDGTFKVVRSPFVQMFSIHAFLHSDGNIKQVPLAFCLMSRRLTIDYKAVLNALTVSMPRRPAVQVAVCDFERGMWKALRKVFDGIVVRGCNFHFTQAVWRRIQRYGLAIPDGFIQVRERQSSIQSYWEDYSTGELSSSQLLKKCGRINGPALDDA